MSEKLSVTTCLWFENKGIEAARFYVSLIPDSRLLTDAAVGDSPMIVDFELAGSPYRILNGGPHYKLNPACSIAVTTPGQAETDRIWDALVDDGGEAGRCGWLIDRWGVSWQVVPAELATMLGASDREAAARAQEAMMGMSRIDIEKMQAAFEAG
ncbi:VOC family protein [Histidinibacterium lentulum]|uniref:VOC family protein n=1 Tax=Histidinibacterium lentulum TaxID=2480588 RepID=A0A3N2R166_9RHOB|nr:VOC family protein [Histidinibacterium lentulum]ROU01123.1 VOC family protein [Histidinibacterium lentulum]